MNGISLPPDFQDILRTASDDAASIVSERGDEVFLYCAAAFFFGVFVSLVLSVTSTKNDAKPGIIANTLTRFLTGAIVFFISSPVQAWVITHNWANSPYTPFDWLQDVLQGAGSIQIQAFAYGLIMLLGVISFDLFRVIRQWALKVMGSIFPTKQTS